MKFSIIAVIFLTTIFSCSDNSVTNDKAEPMLVLTDFIELSAIDSVYSWTNSVKVPLAAHTIDTLFYSFSKMEYLPDTTFETMASGIVLYVGNKKMNISISSPNSEYIKIEKEWINKKTELIDSTSNYLHFNTNGFDLFTLSR